MRVFVGLGSSVEVGICTLTVICWVIVSEIGADTVSGTVFVPLLVTSAVNVDVMVSKEYDRSDVGVSDVEGDADGEASGEADDVGVSDPFEGESESRVCVCAWESESELLCDMETDTFVGVSAIDIEPVITNVTVLE